jgi:hypothetical protein
MENCPSAIFNSLSWELWNFLSSSPVCGIASAFIPSPPLSRRIEEEVYRGAEGWGLKEPSDGWSKCDGSGVNKKGGLYETNR